MQDCVIILASNSPRRKKLIEQLRLNYIQIKLEYNENINEFTSPLEYSLKLSQKKLEQAKNHILSSQLEINKKILLTADTIVTYDNKIFEKPNNEKEAFEILKYLSGKTHKVITTYSLLNLSNNKQITNSVITDVTFWELSDDVILEYISKGNPLDKAGAYGIQDDFGAVLVKEIKGCYYNVVGLPISYLYRDLLELC
ncbi:MAG TPA: nucleoside triphosphate pyrophosphatase [Ignavibacteriales bacterium]|nr:nucleoside triphosphate pyrophosphatase [Ignavibacteriales bacterium]HOL82054.1 nucleoside triphosphate pyrophosphatase [Ignavibacteriales bacterium]HOM66119.1 nucleoside triphosphate pyrophosphatase [Ignavibacteriales bacterium]HPD66453.1 nucleoside triphosphate pyrophosphatase [Ignavibacteriales bacterium]HPP34210.1 nucleoside triphosphate pyrophosphatase [Ignavibacteriales bacterium]